MLSHGQPSSLRQQLQVVHRRQAGQRTVRVLLQDLQRHEVQELVTRVVSYFVPRQCRQADPWAPAIRVSA